MSEGESRSRFGSAPRCPEAIRRRSQLYMRLFCHRWSRLSMELSDLPTELQERILRSVPAAEVHSRLRSVCWNWKAIIDRSVNTLPKIHSRCTVIVFEFPRDSFLQFQFATSRRRRLLIGRTLFSKRLNSEITFCDEEALLAEPLHPAELSRVLRLFEVSQLHIHLRSLGDKFSTEGALPSILLFLHENVGRLGLRDLTLSGCDGQPWTLGPSCHEAFQNVVHLERVLFRNVAGLERLASWKSWQTLSKLTIEDCDIQGVESLELFRLVHRFRTRGFVFDVISHFTSFFVPPEHLCTFISEWATSEQPWLFGSISFNASYGIQEVRKFLRHPVNHNIMLVTDPQGYSIRHCRSPTTMEIRLSVSEAFNVKWLLTVAQ